MLMVLHRAAVHAKTFSTCAARRHTNFHHNLSSYLVSASLTATKRCSLSAQYQYSPTTPHSRGVRTAPSPSTTAQRSAKRSAQRSPSTIQILESSRRRTVSSRASASGTTAAEVSSTQLTDSDPEELSSDSQGEPAPAPDARLDPGLYLVATPIGNLEDITLRAVRILRCADRILAEDTRHTRKLLNHLGIRTPLSSFHEHNERGKQSQVLQQLGLGAALALVSDAGMPAISDPGALLVAAAAAAGHRVIPIPGPSAVLAALIASGLSTENFMFVGFLPAKASARKERLLELVEVRATLIAYVPPHSLAAVLESAAAVLGPERRCVVARELTKMHEELFRTTLGGAAEHYSLNAPRGEITLVIEGAAEGGPESHSEEDLIASLQQAFLDGHSTSSAVKVVRESTGAPKRNLYRLAVQLAELQSQPQEELEGTGSD